MGTAVARDQLEAVDGEPARGGQLLAGRELAVGRAEATLGLQRRRIQDLVRVRARARVGVRARVRVRVRARVRVRVRVRNRVRVRVRVSVRG